VPEDEDTLGLEVVFCFDDFHGFEFSVVRDFCVHVVDHKGLRKVILVIAVGHGLEMKRHHGSALDVSKFVAAGGGVRVGVEELGEGGAVLGEVGVPSAFLPFLVEVHNVIGAGGKQFVQFFVLEHLI